MQSHLQSLAHMHYCNLHGHLPLTIFSNLIPHHTYSRIHHHTHISSFKTHCLQPIHQSSCVCDHLSYPFISLFIIHAPHVHHMHIHSFYSTTPLSTLPLILSYTIHTHLSCLLSPFFISLFTIPTHLFILSNHDTSDPKCMVIFHYSQTHFLPMPLTPTISMLVPLSITMPFFFLHRSLLLNSHPYNPCTCLLRGIFSGIRQVRLGL